LKHIINISYVAHFSYHFVIMSWCLSSSVLILVYLFIVLNAVGLQLTPTCVRTTITMKIDMSFNPVTSINCCKKIDCTQ